MGGSFIVSSVVIKTARDMAEMAKQAKIYGADQPSEFDIAVPSESAYNNTGKKMVTEINQKVSNFLIFLLLYSS
jgi:hypothetical protein